MQYAKCSVRFEQTRKKKKPDEKYIQNKQKKRGKNKKITYLK